MLRTFRVHYLTLTSVGIIAVLFALVMTSDSFVSREDRARDSKPLSAPPSDLVTFKPHGRADLFFIVENQEQLDSLAEAFTADQAARGDGPFAVDRVVFLLAGTPEQESAAIARLNAEVELAQGTIIDMKIADVRGLSGR